MGEDWQERDARRERIINEAVKAANEVIMENTNHSREETNYLTARVAEKFMEKAMHPFEQQIQRKELKLEVQGEHEEKDE